VGRTTGGGGLVDVAERALLVGLVRPAIVTPGVTELARCLENIANQKQLFYRL